MNGRDCDLPCRLVFVVGMPSGGTSCAAGILAKNGFYSKTRKRSYEDGRAHKMVSCVENIWDTVRKQPSATQIHTAATIARDFKHEAITAGFKKAVLKYPGSSIWAADIFQPNSLGVKIDPLLVYRDPKECGNSISRRFPHVPNPQSAAERGQAEIKRLHETRGWPMWTFSKEGNIKELEDLLQVNLPTTHFDPSRIKS